MLANIETKATARNQELEQLKRENESLRKENERLRVESEKIKQELLNLKRGSKPSLPKKP